MNTELIDELAWFYFEAQWEDLNSTLENDNLIPQDWMTK